MYFEVQLTWSALGTGIADFGSAMCNSLSGRLLSASATGTRQSATCIGSSSLPTETERLLSAVMH